MNEEKIRKDRDPMKDLIDVALELRKITDIQDLSKKIEELEKRIVYLEEEEQRRFKVVDEIMECSGFNEMIDRL